jgi:transposase
MSVVEFARQRDLHPNLVHTWRWQARKGMLSQSSNSEARFAPVAVVPAADAMRPSEARYAAVVEVVLRNGRVLRLPEHVTPVHAARLADVLEAGGR